jgi:hypothetical protein
LAAVNTVYTTNQTTIPGAIQDDLFSLVYFSPDSENFICSSLAEFNGKVSDGRITFSEVTQTSLKGVFSGNFYNADYSKTIAITEGEFFVKRYK